ncbi:MAG: FHA domain-containing protein [Zoogloeaceae bacterium]|jgi:pSer/pThr/pTyr-binding forkhead associated (FHA) protein|nr:FHA domain-containing protein [Zoogloeaceae bacterium]
MAKLILSMDGLVLKEIVLDKKRITIGRRPSNDVQINNLAISGEHAAITTILDDSFLEDLDSTNGTLVNGKAIKKRVLHHNDVVTMGKYALKFLKDPEEEKLAQEGRIDVTASAPAAKPPGADTASDVTQKSLGADTSSDVATAVIPAATASNIGTATAFGATNVGSGPFPTLDRNIDVDEPPNKRKPDPGKFAVKSEPASENAVGDKDLMLHELGAHAVLKILNGSNKGKELSLIKTQNTLGRTGIQVVSIACLPQGYVLRHVEGEHPPTVNGIPIKQEQLLNDGDVLEVIGVRMAFRLEF